MAENTPREARESANENNRPQKKSMSSATFLQQFVTDYIAKRPEALKNELVEEAMTKDNLSGTKLAQALAEFRASDEKYNTVDISGESIDIFLVRKYLAKGFVEISKSRQDLEEKILKEYDMTPEIYQQKIAAKVKDLGNQGLQELLLSEQKLRIFLKKTLGTEAKPRVTFDFLKGVSESQIQSRLKTIPEPDKSEISATLLKINNGGAPRDDEMRQIIESSLLTEAQKIAFVHQFVPFVTLQEALDMGLINEAKLKKIKSDFIEAATRDQKLTAENIQEVEKTLLAKDIRIATKDLIKSEAGVRALSEKVGFSQFEEDIRATQEEALEELRKDGPTNFEALKIFLASLGEAKCKNASLFSPGNIVKFTKKRASGDMDIDYIRIVDFDDDTKVFRYQNIGNESVNLKNPGEAKEARYEDFASNMKLDPTTLEVMTLDALKDNIKKGKVESSELTLLNASDLQGDEMSEKRSEILQNELTQLQKELQDLQNLQAKKSTSGKKDTDLEAKIASKKREISSLQGRSQDFEMLKNLANKQEIISKLDDIDPDGKGLGLDKNVAFHTGKGEDWNTYTIRDVDFNSWEIRIQSRAGVEKPMSLDAFYAQFKKKGAKRAKRVHTPEDLVSSIDSWKDIAFKDGDIIQKDAEDGEGKKADRAVEYLGSKENDTLLKIVSLSGGIAEVQVGERKEAKLSDAEKARGDKKDVLHIQGASTEQWSLDELKRYIEDNKLSPDWRIGKTIKVIPEEHRNKFHGSFTEKLFKNISLYELIHGGKMVVEGITESMKHGSDVKSAKAALALGGFLPEELREDLRAKVESAESEEMDKALKQLGAVDSPIAVGRIERWLLNKDTPEYKKEAGILFMLEKYGHLTAKGPLYPYRGRFLWYEALGGHKNDALYNEIKANAEAEGQTFTEEKLVHMLLKKQCSGKHYSGIHRRSRLHKEYENKWKSGVEGEIEKGYKDASNFRQTSTIVKEGLGEATGGTTSNAFGWAKKGVERGGSLEDMTKIPFAILYSGACFDLDQVTYTKVKGLWDGDGQPIIALRMFANTGTMKLFNKIILQLSQEIGDAYPDEFPNIKAEAKKLYEDAQSGNGEEKERLTRAINFWKKYGTPLSRGMHLSLQPDTKYSATDTIIRRKREQNSDYAEYYNLVRGAVGEGNAYNKDFVDDAIGETGVFGLNPYDISLKYLIFDQGGGFREKSIGPKIWNRYVDDINATRDKILVAGEELDSPKNRAEQERYIAELLQDIIAAFYEMGALRTDYIFGLNKGTSTVGRELNKWGFNLEQDLGAVSSVDIMNGDYNNVFRKVARNIISGNTGSGTDTSPDVLMRKIKDQTASNLNKKTDYMD